MAKYDGSKFRFSEVFNNANGKTSGSGFMGVLLGMMACVSFLAAMVGWFMEKNDVIDVMEQIIIVIGAVTVLLGVRKFAGTRKDGSNIVDTDNINESKKQKEDTINNEKG